MPLVSVIVPTYPPAPFLLEALASARKQKGVDLEILLVDDASPEPWRAEVISAASSFGARLITRATRGGPAAAHNTGIGESSGDYLAFLEHDDLFLPEKVSTQVAALEAHPEWGMCYAGGFLLDSEGRVIKKLTVPCYQGSGVLKGLLQGNFIPSMSSVVVRQACLKEVGLLDETFHIAHDYDLWLRIALSRWLIGMVPRALVGVRSHASNFSAQNQRCGIEETLRVLEKTCHDRPDLWQWAQRHYARCWYRLGKFFARYGDWTQAKACYRQAFSVNPMLYKAYWRWAQAALKERSGRANRQPYLGR